MSVAGKSLDSLKRYFLSGVLVVVPFVLTFLVLSFLFEGIDGVLRPFLSEMLGYYRTGLGALTTCLIILLAGVLTRNLVGARIYRLGDRLIAQVPLIRPIYSATKQLLTALTRAEAKSFQEVALIEYPRRGIYSICLISQRTNVEIDGVSKAYCICFVPFTPTPVSGTTVVIPDEDVQAVDMTVEDGIKFLVSGGVTSPKSIKNRTKKPDGSQ